MLKSMRNASVTCTCRLTRESNSSWRGQNNLKIIDLVLERSQKNHANFQIMFKHYVSWSSNRGLACFGEFPHKENSILVFAVNCCIFKLYANYASEFCSLADIFFLKFTNVPFLNC